MKHTYLLLFVSTLFVSTLFVSCVKTRDKSITPTYKIDPETSKVFLYSEHFDELKYLKLELDLLNPIGRIKQLICYNDGYFIFDNITNKVFHYSLEGKIRFVLNRKGKGPGEYQEISSISLSYPDSLLVIYDKSAASIKFYSTLNGRFKKALYLQYLPLSITYFGDEKIVAYMNFNSHPKEVHEKEPHNLIYFNDPAKILSSFLPYDPNLAFPNYSANTFTGSGSRKFFTPPFYNEVFVLDSKSCTPFLTIDFGKYNFNEKVFEGTNSSSERSSNLYKSNLVFSKFNFHEFSKYYFFNFTWKGTVHRVLINKENNNVSVFNASKNDINQYPGETFLGCSGNKMYFAIEPFDMIATRNQLFSAAMNGFTPSKEREKFKQAYLSIDSIFGKLHDTDNMILGIYNLK